MSLQKKFTAKHVLAGLPGEVIELGEDGTQIFSRRAGMNGKYSKVVTQRISFGYFNQQLLHNTCDLAVFLPFSDNFLSNVIEGLSAVRLPTANEVQDLRRLIMNTPNEFQLAKNGCATGITRAEILSVSEVAIDVKGTEVRATAYYDDSGALWIIIQSPGGHFNQVIAGIASYITVTENIVGRCLHVDIVCSTVPVLLWLD